MISKINIVQVDHKAIVTSREVARAFKKKHFHVLRDIENLLKLKPDFGASNFGASNYLDKQGKNNPLYHITRDGFVLLVMGYTGEKALELKIAYIEQFNAMESYIKNNLVPNGDWHTTRQLGKEGRLTLTDTIKDFLIPAAIKSGSRNYDKLYMCWSKMMNDLILEKLPWEKKKNETARDYLDVADLALLRRFEEDMAKLIKKEILAGNDYKIVYQIAKERLSNIMQYMSKFKPALPNKQKLKVLNGGKC